MTAPQCTRIIPTSQEEVTRAEPGDVLCLEAGTRGELELTGLVGTSAKPITVVNRGGVVRIHAPGDYAAIEVEGSEHVRVTGTGQAAQCGATAATQQCGIVLSGAGRGVAAKVLPRHLSFDHLEIRDVSGAGVTIKDNDQPRGSFVARDIVLRDSYLHDIGDEAVYIGSSDYATGTPHLLDGVHVDRNRVVNTGRDGLQVGSTPWNCTMNGNVVRNVGLNGESSHQFGIIVNRGASCDVIGNDIAGAPRSGIYDQGLHGQVIADNVIRDVGETGINVRDGNQSASNPETRDYPNSTHILRNAIDGTRQDGIRLGNDDGTDNRIDDNTFRNVGGWLIYLSSGVTATLSGNAAG